ncbi:hypothetical protein EBB07_03825 [Paenibacillaceae bacterium]|nr:hypothetical protein EBB07_03825 [Paenibacillaceae bacterium]
MVTIDGTSFIVYMVFKHHILITKERSVRMEWFAVSLASAKEEMVWKLSRYLSDAFAELQLAPGAVELQWDIDIKNGIVRCLGPSRLPRSRAGKLQQAVIRQAVQGLSEYVIAELEPGLLSKIVRQESGYESAEECRKIEAFCINLLDENEYAPDDNSPCTNRKKRMQGISAELLLYLTERPTINLHGFVAFRLADYRESLREVVKYAVDEYILEKQYQDFIALLKYFVGVQEAKIPIVHVIHSDKEQFSLCDGYFQTLDNRVVDDWSTEFLESEMNLEDRVVSSLIAAAPQKIVIHSREPNKQMIRTIDTIFSGRVTMCRDCPACRSHYQKREI